MSGEVGSKPPAVAGRRDAWVLVEGRQTVLDTVSIELLEDARTVARALGGAVWAGGMGRSFPEEWASLLGSHGADRILWAEHPLLDPYTTDAHLVVLVDLVREHHPALILLPATANGRDLASCLAARLSASILSGCISLRLAGNGLLEAVRPVYNNRIYCTVQSLGPPWVATLRPGVVGVGAPDRSRKPPLVTRVQPCLDPTMIRTSAEPPVSADPHTLDLREAERIVAGGRGVGGPEGFALLEELADLLGASTGGTRVAVDLGWLPFERQIGQSGKMVAPEFYLAVGVSGASQHLMGVKDSRIIIALNTDRTAPIFQVAKLGAVGDWREILPRLIAGIRRTRAGAAGNPGTAS